MTYSMLIEVPLFLDLIVGCNMTILQPFELRVLFRVNASDSVKTRKAWRKAWRNVLKLCGDPSPFGHLDSSTAHRYFICWVGP